MGNLYSITTNQAAIIALFRVINRYVGNLPPMPGVFPDYPAPVVRNTDSGLTLTKMRRGMPPPHGWSASYQHPQHVVTALAGLAEAGEPLSGARQQLCRIRARAESGDKEEGRGVVPGQAGALTPPASPARGETTDGPGR
jgi:hypothetical protein